MRSIDLIGTKSVCFARNVIDRSHPVILRRVELTGSPEALGGALYRRRQDLSMTQENLALAIGVHRRVIGELEKGKPGVRLEIVLNAARALGLDIGVEPRGGSRP